MIEYFIPARLCGWQGRFYRTGGPCKPGGGGTVLGEGIHHTK